MAVRKPLTHFTTPLGSGAGVPKNKRPPKVHDSATRLLKPFQVPFKTRLETVSGIVSRRPVRSSRKFTNYAVEDFGNGSADDENVNESGDVVKCKRFGALLPRSINSDGRRDVIDNKIKRSFTVPFSKDNAKKDEMIRGPPPPLGTKVRPIIPPRALHDPMSEFAIVLYDPTVDVIPKTPEEEKKIEELDLSDTSMNL